MYSLTVRLETKSRPVAALRLCADEKPSARIAESARIKTIRADSAISYKNNPLPLLLLTVTAFFARMPFIRAENAVGARSAQSSRNRLRVFPHFAGTMEFASGKRQHVVAYDSFRD